MKNLLIITPPFTQLNTPYPASAYIKGFLNTKDISSFQMDLGIEVILQLFSKEGLVKIFSEQINSNTISENSQRIFALKEDYITTIDQVILFLQNRNPTLARQISSMNFLPEASRFNQLDDLDYSFGNMVYRIKQNILQRFTWKIFQITLSRILTPISVLADMLSELVKVQTLLTNFI